MIHTVRDLIEELSVLDPNSTVSLLVQDARPPESPEAPQIHHFSVDVDVVSGNGSTVIRGK